MFLLHGDYIFGNDSSLEMILVGIRSLASCLSGSDIVLSPPPHLIKVLGKVIKN